MLIHGFTGAPHEVEPIGQALMSQGVSSIGPLLPGHGTDVHDLNHTSWQAWVEAVEDAIQEALHRWRAVFVGGLSMGGSLALLAAARWSTELNGAVVLAAPVRLHHFALPLLPLIARWRQSRAKTGTGLTDPSLVAERVCYDHQPLRGVVQLMRLLHVVRERLPAVTCPVFLAHSRRDRTIPFRNLRAIEEGISSRWIQTLVLEASDHLLPLDLEREQLFAGIGEFIREHRGT